MLLPPKYSEILPLSPGKNAKVFKARNSYMNRDVFLKLYAIPTDDPLSALSEPRALQELEHDHITKIFGVDELADQHLLLEMELVTGGSFQEIITSSTSSGSWPPVHECLDLVQDAAYGLSYLHSRGYIHQDVKPANLVIRNPGAHGKGVVADLGCISRINADGRAFSGKQSRLYRPPEAWEGRGYSPASDVYQLGIVLFQLLGGTIDYSLSDLPDSELARAILEGELANVESLGPHVGRQLREIIERTLCAEEQRIKSMGDLVIELNSIKSKHPNWKFSVIKDGFSMKCQTNKAGEFAVEVSSKGNCHTIRRFKRTKLGQFRNMGSPTSISHKDLSSCLAFRKLTNPNT